MAQTPKQTQEPPPQRHGRITPIAGDARATAASAFARMGFSDPTLVLRWREIAGAEVARLAQPVRLSDGPSGGTLTLRAVPGAALFLAHEKRALAEHINAFLGHAAVSQIKFSQSATLPPRPSAPPPQKKPHALPASDPSRAFSGPEGLAKALQALARRR
jgi:hypothetical protein